MIPRSRLAIAVALGILLTTGFFGLDYYLAGKEFHDISVALDHRIPFLPVWVWVYTLYYPLCFLPLIFPGVLSNESLFRRTAAGFLIQFLVAWPIFYFYPTALPRPELETGSLSALVLGWIYAADPGYNIFPSLHVANVFFVSCLAGRFISRAWQGLLFFLSALITVSTVCIKQHLLLDLPAGFVLGVLAYWASFAGYREGAPPRK
jgi:hypothetical protein